MGPIREDGSDKFYGMENVSSFPIAVLLCASFSSQFADVLSYFSMEIPGKSSRRAISSLAREQGKTMEETSLILCSTATVIRYCNVFIIRFLFAKR
jgi:hypothetical protein